MRSQIADNLERVRERIHQAALKAGRNPEEVSLLLATKTVEVERIREAIQAGQMLFGENRVQEALPKFQELRGEKTTLHMIGHLQSNKAKDALLFAACIESVDSCALMAKLDSLLQRSGRSVDILIEVNTSGEASKFGVNPDELVPLLETAARYPSLRVKGLMTMGPNTTDPERIQGSFRQLRELLRKAREEGASGTEMSCLSMGMSHDFEIAIEEGSTLVRLGTAVFGARQQ
jgi:hypothetical protein